MSDVFGDESDDLNEPERECSTENYTQREKGDRIYSRGINILSFKKLKLASYLRLYTSNDHVMC